MAKQIREGERTKVRGCVWIQGVHFLQENKFGLASIRQRDRLPRNQQPPRDSLAHEPTRPSAFPGGELPSGPRNQAPPSGGVGVGSWSASPNVPKQWAIVWCYRNTLPVVLPNSAP